MKKIKAFKSTLVLIMLLLITCVLTGCKGPRWLSWLPWVEYQDFDIITTFSFYKDGNKKEQFEGNEFEINTRIYVCVDFTITKKVEAEEVISFVVQIPYAEYYSTKDFYRGTIEPHEREYIQRDTHGNEYMVKELSQMNFVLSDNESHDFHYVFEIEANQVCEFADFIVRFKPENSNLDDVYVNGERVNMSKVSYTFKAKEN